MSRVTKKGPREYTSGVRTGRHPRLRRSRLQERQERLVHALHRRRLFTRFAEEPARAEHSLDALARVMVHARHLDLGQRRRRMERRCAARSIRALRPAPVTPPEDHRGRCRVGDAETILGRATSARRRRVRAGRARAVRDRRRAARPVAERRQPRAARAPRDVPRALRRRARRPQLAGPRRA
jgi:hypothetical protein